jgi:hypothetical protein
MGRVAAAAVVVFFLSGCGSAGEVRETAGEAGPPLAGSEMADSFSEDWDAFPSFLGEGRPVWAPCFFEFSVDPWGKTCKEYAREGEERGIPSPYWSAH